MLTLKKFEEPWIYSRNNWKINSEVDLSGHATRNIYNAQSFSLKQLRKVNASCIKFLSSFFRVSQVSRWFQIATDNYVSSDMQQLDGRISAVFSKAAACPMDTFVVLEYFRHNHLADDFFCVSGRRFPCGQSRKTSGKTRVVIINFHLRRKFLMSGVGAQNFWRRVFMSLLLSCSF